MRRRCLIIDSKSTVRGRLESVLREISGLHVQSVRSFQAAAASVQSRCPNLVLLRVGDPQLPAEDVLEVIQRIKVRVSTVLIVEKPDPERIKRLLNRFKIADVLTDDADDARIRQALENGIDQTGKNTDQRSYYRGFIGFVGVIPSLRERKVLASAGIGLIHNRSLRLAIEYWRKNPNSQLIAVCFNFDESFTSRPEEILQVWNQLDVRPFEVGLYEAQRHYLDYWQVPIREGSMPTIIPVLLRHGTQDLEIMTTDEQKRSLVKVGKKTRQGMIEQTLNSLGIAFRAENFVSKGSSFEAFISKLEKQMEEVDKKHPELTRPPSETGWEDFKPDVAKPYQENAKRMAFMEGRSGK